MIGAEEYSVRGLVEGRGVVINGGSPLRMGALCGGQTLGDNRA